MIPAKGLTGSGYDGHAFWDTEIFVLPMLAFTCPRCVAEALRWRQATPPAARGRARQLGLKGAAFPWLTIDGVAFLAGSWIALVCGFGGTRRRPSTLHFAPELPEKPSRLAF